MQFKQLLADDDAVSPVIGVILMVAITVILAAVIGTFVLGLGEQVQSTSPTTSFGFDFDESVSTAGNTDCGDITSETSGTDGGLTVTHESGDSVDADLMSIVVGGTSTDFTSCGFSSSDEVSAGSTFDAYVNSADTARIVWESSDGETSATLGRWDGPDA